MPPRHPADSGVGDIVRSRRLADEARDVTVAWISVEMVAKIFAEHAAGVGDTGGPVAGFGIEHDVSGLDAGSREDDCFAEGLDFAFVVPIDISDTRGVAVFVDQHRTDQGVSEQGEVLGVLGFRDCEPGRREE